MKELQNPEPTADLFVLLKSIGISSTSGMNGALTTYANKSKETGNLDALTNEQQKELLGHQAAKKFENMLIAQLEQSDAKSTKAAKPPSISLPSSPNHSQKAP